MMTKDGQDGFKKMKFRPAVKCNSVKTDADSDSDPDPDPIQVESVVS